MGALGEALVLAWARMRGWRLGADRRRRGDVYRVAQSSDLRARGDDHRRAAIGTGDPYARRGAWGAAFEREAQRLGRRVAVLGAGWGAAHLVSHLSFEAS